MEEIFAKVLPELKEYLFKYNNLYVEDENLISFIKIEIGNLNNESGIKILDKSNDFKNSDGIFVYFFPEPYILKLDYSKIKKVKIPFEEAIKLISLCLFARIVTVQEFVKKENEIMALSQMTEILKKYNI